MKTLALSLALLLGVVSQAHAQAQTYSGAYVYGAKARALAIALATSGAAALCTTDSCSTAIMNLACVDNEVRGNLCTFTTSGSSSGEANVAPIAKSLSGQASSDLLDAITTATDGKIATHCDDSNCRLSVKGLVCLTPSAPVADSSSGYCAILSK